MNIVYFDVSFIFKQMKSVSVHMGTHITFSSWKKGQSNVFFPNFVKKK